MNMLLKEYIIEPLFFCMYLKDNSIGWRVASTSDFKYSYTLAY
jgi:hypothetical protein